MAAISTWGYTRNHGNSFFAVVHHAPIDRRSSHTSSGVRGSSRVGLRNLLADRQGKIIGQDLRGEALEEALTKALTNTR
jgi:hypothetical protein